MEPKPEQKPIDSSRRSGPTPGPSNAPETSFDLELPDRGEIHIGDKIIHTTGPVYNTTVNVYPDVSSNRKDSPQQKCEELKILLKERVAEIACEESSLAQFSDKPLTPVNLSIVNQPRKIDDEFQADGHYHRKEELSEAFEESSTAVSAQQLLNLSKDKATGEARRIFASQQVQAKQAYIEKHGNVVGVVGQAGIGKTTSAKKWAQQALSDQLVGNVSYFFYVVIRFIDFKKKMTMLQFLVSTMLPDWNCTSDEAEYIMKDIRQDPNVLMIFDGFDEAAFKSFSSKVPITMMHSKNKSEVYLKHLSGGNLLPRARKIFTSRPAPFYSLHPSHRPKFIVQILGLNQESQDALGRQICGDKYDQIEEKLSQNKMLFAYCYVPVNFILTVHYLMSYDGDIQFVSLARVLSFTCVQYSQTEHQRAQACDLDKLAKLAWDGFENKQIVFKSKDFNSAQIDEATVDAFLNTSITKRGNIKLTIMDGHKCKYFSHLIWQEFFAAVYLMMIAPLTKFKKKQAMFTLGRWEVVTRFIFGLCDSAVYDDLYDLIPGCFREGWNTKKELLRRYVRSCMKVYSEEGMARACGWAREANDQELTTIVAEWLPEVIDVRYSPLPVPDIKDIFFVVAERSKPIQELILTGNKIGDSGATAIAHCIHKVEKIEMYGCQIGHVGMEELSKAMEHLSTPIEELRVSNNFVEDAGAKALARCIHNLEKVWMSGCGVTEQGVRCIAQEIARRQRPVKVLDLSYNKIASLETTLVGDCLYNIESLSLQKCGIGLQDIQYLSKKIAALERPVMYLNMSFNNLTDECADPLAACVHNVSHFIAEYCRFTEHAKTLISSKAKGKAEF